MHDLTVPKWLYLSPASRYRQPADELRSVSLLRLSSPGPPPPSLAPPPPQMANQQRVLSSKEPHFARNKPIALATHLVICALCCFPSHTFFFFCALSSASPHADKFYDWVEFAGADARQNHFFPVSPSHLAVPRCYVAPSFRGFNCRCQEGPALFWW